jgi:FkbM family methyltransferase
MIEYKDLRAYETIQTDIEKKFHTYIGKTAEEIKTIVIAGAYHGYEIERILSAYKNATIYAIEAYPKNFKVLLSRYANNQRVRLFNLAVSDKRGTATFFELSDIGNGSLLESTNESKIADAVSVETDTISNLINEPIDLLWADVQGSELTVLAGTDLKNTESLFLEIAVRGMQPQQYKNQCFLDELELFLKDTHRLYSIGLDNEYKNGIGNSFWIRK